MVWSASSKPRPSSGLALAFCLSMASDLTRFMISQCFAFRTASRAESCDRRHGVAPKLPLVRSSSASDSR
jgi:hypothetical protein